MNMNNYDCEKYYKGFRNLSMNSAIILNANYGDHNYYS